jgi:membrane protease YdiL (CAAX protease family)
MPGLVPGIHVFCVRRAKDVDGRDEPGHDDFQKSLMPAESLLMDALDPALSVAPVPDILIQRPPRVWKFWGTALWGLLIFAAMFVGQLAVVAWFVLLRGGPIDMAAAVHVVSGGLTISLSVIMGLPAVLAALWLAIRLSGTPFADYLALRWTSWRNVLIGVVSLFIMVMAWDLLSRATGREVEPGFMAEVLKSARADGGLWLLLIAFCIAAPISEELFARGFLYRGWSESFLRVPGAILLSSLVWTGLHLQYDWFFLGEVFSIGLLLGYLRYRSQSLWLTIVLHGLNNLAATLQTMWLAGSS